MPRPPQVSNRTFHWPSAFFRNGIRHLCLDLYLRLLFHTKIQPCQNFREDDNNRQAFLLPKDCLPFSALVRKLQQRIENSKRDNDRHDRLVTLGEDGELVEIDDYEEDNLYNKRI